MGKHPSSRFPPVPCPLCAHPQLWRGVDICPGCFDQPKRGAGQISRFKLPILYIKFPGLSQVDTIKEMPAVKPEEPKK